MFLSVFSSHLNINYEDDVSSLFLLYSFVHIKFFKFSLSKITKPNNNFVLKSRGTGDRIGYLVIAGSAGGYFFGKRKGNLFFLSPFLSFSRHGVLMVIQSMRFIDNGRTVPQVLKASPPLSTLSSSPRSRGMHPIIGTLSVSLRGDNDALPPIQPPPLSLSLLFSASQLSLSSSCSRISIACKKSHLSIVFRVTR